MFIQISADDDAPVLLAEADDFTRFHVEVAGLDADELSNLVRRCGVGYVTADGHVAVPVATIKALAGTRSPEWDESFDHMVSYAKSKGWMTGDHYIQAHCVRQRGRSHVVRDHSRPDLASS